VQKASQSISKGDLQELKALANPPPVVAQVASVINAMFGVGSAWSDFQALCNNPAKMLAAI